jgi:hypothetical protein
MVISPLTEFMALTMEESGSVLRTSASCPAPSTQECLSFMRTYGNNDRSLAFGVSGTVEQLAKGYSYAVIASLGTARMGVVNAVKEWGDKLLRYYGKSRFHPRR